MVGCSIVGCKNKSGKGEMSFFSFPKDAEKSNEWLRHCRPTTNIKHGRICSQHFVTSDYDQSYLFKLKLMGYGAGGKVRKIHAAAVPSQHLPGQDLPSQQTPDDSSAEAIQHIEVVPLSRTVKKKQAGKSSSSLGEGRSECCHLCLCTERELTSAEGVLDVYQLLVGVADGGTWDVSTFRACWECHALLRRVSRFRRQARLVRELLDSVGDILLDSETCLSKLEWTSLGNINIKEKSHHNTQNAKTRDKKIKSEDNDEKSHDNVITHDDAKTDDLVTHDEATNDDVVTHYDSDEITRDIIKLNKGSIIVDIDISSGVDPLSDDIKQEHANDTEAAENKMEIVKTEMMDESIEIIEKAETSEPPTIPRRLLTRTSRVEYVSCKIDGVQTLMKGVKVTEAQLMEFLEKARSNVSYVSAPYKCDFCLLGFKKCAVLLTHMDKYKHDTHPIFEHICQICHRGLSSSEELETHQKAHQFLYQCLAGDFASVCPLNVHRHYLENHAPGDEAFTPHQILASEHSRKSTGKRHQTTPKNEEPVVKKRKSSSKPHVKRRPNISVKRMKRRPKLRPKTASTKTKLPHKSKRFLFEWFKPTREELLNMQTTLQFVPTRSSCSDCCENYYSEELLTEHRKQHEEDAGDYVCEVCKLRFPSKDLLATHEPSHEVWYRCKMDPTCQYVAHKWKKFKQHAHYRHMKKEEPQNEFERFRPTEEQLRNRASLFNYLPRKNGCDDCCEVFPSEDKLREHLLLHSEVSRGQGSCRRVSRHMTRRDCCEVFLYEVKLREHLLLYPRYRLNCCEVFLSENKLREHVLPQSETAGAYECGVCLLRFPLEDLLAEHRAVHENWFRCKADPTCSFVAMKKGTIAKHVFKKHKQKKRTELTLLRCDVCDKTLTHRAGLIAHMKIHDKQHMCEECGYLLTTRTLLLDHVRRYHADDESIRRRRRRYNDNEPRPYKSESKRETLPPRRPGEPFVCEFCSKRYPDQHTFRYHRNKHLQLKPYACKQCDAKFSHPTDRSIHVRQVHLGKFYPNYSKGTHLCKVCLQNFPNKFKLNEHYQTHAEILKYKCDKCPRAFIRYNTLIDHQAVHTEERNHECHICHKKFAVASGLTLHIVRSHGKEATGSGGKASASVVRSQACNECGKPFRTVSAMKEHLKTHEYTSPDVHEFDTAKHDI